MMPARSCSSSAPRSRQRVYLLVLALLLLGGLPSRLVQVRAQTLPAPLRLVPGLERYQVSRPQLSHDGRRLRVIAVDDDGRAEAIVVDVRTGHILARRAPLDTAAGAVLPVLSTDGTRFVFAEHGVSGPMVNVLDIDTGVVTDSFTAVPGLQLGAVSDVGRVVAFSAPLVFGFAQGVNVSPQPPFVLRYRASLFHDPCSQQVDDVPGATAPVRVDAVGFTGPSQISASGRFFTLFRHWASAYGPNPEFSGRNVLLFQVGSTITCLRITDPRFRADPAPEGAASMSSDGRWLGVTAVARDSGVTMAMLIETDRPHHSSTAEHVLAVDAVRTEMVQLGRDARHILLRKGQTLTGPMSLDVFDRVTGVSTTILDAQGPHAAALPAADAVMSDDGRTVIVTARHLPLSAGDTQAHRSRAFVAVVDADDDGLMDAWERTYGLDPTTATDAAGDPDGDGQTNLQEFEAGAHPLAAPVRYFAEGYSSPLFETSLAVFNPSDRSALVNVRFMGADGRQVAMPLTLPAHTPAYIDPADLGLTADEYATVVESRTPLAVERRMTWDRVSHYGSHVSNGLAAPATTWFFAEGATTPGFQTFYLLANPGSTIAVPVIRYLLADGTFRERGHVLPARTRLTIWANAEETLGSAEFAATITSDVPIVAERAMYRDTPDAFFGAGSVSAGIATPSTSWFFAEGATGSFFDTYLLLANPGAAPTTATVTYTRAGRPAPPAIVRVYVLPPSSRLTVWVAQEDPALRDAEVSARVIADTAIVAERTMWWPGPTAETWRENHTEAGAPSGGTAWAVADILADADPAGTDTFILIAGLDSAPAVVRTTVSCVDGTRVTRDIRLGAHRTTLWMRYEFPEIVGLRCGATIVSLIDEATLATTPVVVEKAMYSGPGFMAGGASLATRLPEAALVP